MKKAIKNVKEPPKELLKNIKEVSKKNYVHEDNKKVEVYFNLYQRKDPETKTYYGGYDYDFTDEGEEIVSINPKRFPFSFILRRGLINKFESGIINSNGTDITEIINLLKKYNKNQYKSLSQFLISNELLAFKITSKVNIEEVKPKTVVMNAKKFQNDNDNKCISSYYTKYQANLKAQTFKELLEVEHIDYIKNNFRPNSCFLTAIINKFYNDFNYIKTDGKRSYKELTYSYLCELLNIPDNPSNNAVSFDEVVEGFFSKFSFAGIYIYDTYNKLILSHEPKNKQNGSDRYKILKMIAHGEHLYEMNDNLKKLEQTTTTQIDEIIKVSNKYQIKKNVDSETIIEYFSNTPQEILQVITANLKTENIKIINIITSVVLDDILFQLLESNYIPRVSHNEHFIYKLTLNIENKLINILCADDNPIYGRNVAFNNLEDYKAYDNAYNQTYVDIIKKEHLSEHHETVLDMDEYYKIGPLVGSFETSSSKKQYNIIDRVKAYTKCIMDIKEIPIFNYFDVYKTYDNHDIEDLTYYIIELNEMNDHINCLFDNKVNKVFGYILKELNIKYKILYYRRPLKTDIVDYETPIKHLYENDKVSIEHKKNIVNKITGLLEQKFNKSMLSKIFYDFDEANYYSAKYQGEISTISSYEGKEIKSEFDGEITTSFEVSKKLYLVNIKNERKLVNGLTPIKDMIYLNQRLEMYKLFKILINNNITIHGARTDCFYYSNGNIDILKSIVKLNNEIGNYKLDVGKYPPENILTINNNEIKPIVKFGMKEVKTLNDEYNTKEINEYISENKIIMIEGLYPGVGKSTIAKNYDNKALFVCPYNKLCQTLKTENYNSITYCKLFGLYCDELEVKHLKPIDISKYNTIVFDEIFLYEPARLKRICELVKENKDKVFIGTGDCDQRDPIEFSDSNYIKNCIDVIFPNKVILNVIKRLKSEVDKKRWVHLKADIFNTKKSIETICKENNLNVIRKMDDVKTLLNVAYFNKMRCERVNKHIHYSVLKNKEDYKVGQEIICKKYERKKDLLLNVNYTYKIIKLTKTDAIIRDEVDEKDYKITMNMLYTNFKLPYCLTCDSIQGLSFGEDDKITIFDSNIPHTDRKFLWTAITRARKLDNVSIFIHSQSEVEALTQSKIRLYFNIKVNGYKAQDKKANREFDENNYVSEQWINEKLTECNYTCKYCKIYFDLSIDENANINSNISVDRINNKLPHAKANCQLCCVSCNKSKSDKY